MPPGMHRPFGLHRDECLLVVSSDFTGLFPGVTFCLRRFWRYVGPTTLFLSSSLTDTFIYAYVRVPSCLYVHSVQAGACRGQRRASAPPELQSQVAGVGDGN